MRSAPPQNFSAPPQIISAPPQIISKPHTHTRTHARTHAGIKVLNLACVVNIEKILSQKNKIDLKNKININIRMSHKSTNKQLMNLSLDEIKKLYYKRKQEVNEDYKEVEEKMKFIEKINKLDEIADKIKQGKVIPKVKPKIKQDKLKTKSKPKLKSKPKPKKIKTFEDYFEECIKNKKIPKDTPPYLRKALERVMRENEQGIELEKSSLEGFAQKYVIKGEPGVLPKDFFIDKYYIIKEFLEGHRNTKVKFILNTIMEKTEKVSKEDTKTFTITNYAYFHSDTYINLVSTNVKDIIKKSEESIFEKISSYLNNGSGWYFKEIVKLEIHINEYQPMRGSSYIPLPDWIMRKKAIVSIRNEDNKCFIWSVLRYLHPKEKHDNRLSDLKKYEFSLNTKGITFPIKVKDITKFENLNPDIPGINVFSIDDNHTIYPLREVKKDGKKTIDLFLYEKDGKFHYSLIKNFSRLVRSQITKRTNDKILICKRCFSHFTKPELLEKHMQYC